MHAIGTLISDRHVVTAAEIFNEIEYEDSSRQAEDWEALPGAHLIDDLDNFQSADWTDITSIELHPKYWETYWAGNINNE